MNALRNPALKPFLAALALLALPLGCAAWQVPPSGISVEILADDGQVLRQFDVTRKGEHRTRRAYLEATRGQRYGIRVRNHTGARVGLVLAVDGRNIISGAKSHLRRTEPMYILDPHRTATYDGWRTSDTQVHRFFFTESDDSYAGAFGDRSAMGVIAVAAFAERRPPQVKQFRKEQSRNRAGEAAPMPESSRSAKSAPEQDAESRAGTGFGEGRESRVVRVHFEPQKRPFARRFVKYEWRQTLVRLGILPSAQPPNRFWPRDSRAAAEGFAPYPPGYWNHR